MLVKSNALAIALLNNGIEKSDIILTISENSIELVIALFASIFLGITIYPISPMSSNVFEMKTLLESLNSLTIFTSESKAEIIEKALNENNNKMNVKNIIVLNGVYNNYRNFDELIKEGENQCLDKIPYFEVNNENDIFVLLQSSGTTGLPKSVMISHRAFMAVISHILNIKLSFDNQVYSQIISFASMAGMAFLFSYTV